MRHRFKRRMSQFSIKLDSFSIKSKFHIQKYYYSKVFIMHFCTILSLVCLIGNSMAAPLTGTVSDRSSSIALENVQRSANASVVASRLAKRQNSGDYSPSIEVSAVHQSPSIDFPNVLIPSRTSFLTVHSRGKSTHRYSKPLRYPIRYRTWTV